MTDEQIKLPLSTADIAAESEIFPSERRERKEEKSTNGYEEQPVPLLENETEEEFTARWTAIQAMFVDNPRSAVEQADSLVAELMKHIAQMFADERSNLEEQWVQTGDAEPNTEDLRIALQHYRSFFYRLLSL
jgi:hypothetical protein